MIFKKSPYKLSSKNRGQRPFNYKKGFSIVELAVVAAIIAILSALTYYSYTKIADQNRVTSLKSDLTKASVDLQEFYNTYSKYPDTIDCNTGNNSTNLCLQSTDGNSYAYSKVTTPNPAYSLVATNISGSYIVTNSSVPTAVVSYGLVTSGMKVNLDASVNTSYSGSGASWFDISGNTNNGTLGGSPTYSTDGGGSLVFNGTSNTGQVSSVTIASFANGFTWGGWVKTTAFSGAWSWICASSNANNGQAYSWFQIGKKTGDGNIRFETGTFFTNTSLDTTTVNIADGSWHYVLGTVDLSAGTKNIYVDGAIKSSASAAVSNTAPDYGSLVFGAQQRTNNSWFEFWNGNIGAIHVYSRALSALEVLQNFNASKSRYGY